MQSLWESPQAPCCFKGVQWSPDGTCVLTALDDGSVLLYEYRAVEGAHDLVPAVRVREPDAVYDYQWHPAMTSLDRETSLFATTARDQPVHVWDAFDGHLRGSFGARNGGDELHPVLSIGMSPDGFTMYGGAKDGVYVFNLERPGRDLRWWSMREGNAPTDFKGLISCQAFERTAGHGQIIALGSYAGQIALLDEQTSTHLMTLQSHRQGVSIVRFSHCGMYLWSGGRCDPDLICWDVRFPQQPLHRLPRALHNHQRVDFALDRSGRFVIAPGQDGVVNAYDVLELPIFPSSDKAPSYWSAHIGPGDSCNGISLHPTLPLAATSSGQRHFDLPDADSDDDTNDTAVVAVIDNALRLSSITLDAERTIIQHVPNII